MNMVDKIVVLALTGMEAIGFLAGRVALIIDVNT